MSLPDQYTIARKVAYAPPVAVGWSSSGDHPMSHDAPLTHRQFLHLLHCGVVRTDDEVKRADREEAGGDEVAWLLRYLLDNWSESIPVVIETFEDAGAPQTLIDILRGME